MKYALDYRHLPALPLKMIFKIFERAGVTASAVSRLTGYSRLSLQRWEEGEVDPHPATQEQVSVLAYRVLRALLHRKLPTKKRIGDDDLLELLVDASYDRALKDYAPEELLPAQWLKALTPQPETSDATA